MNLYGKQTLNHSKWMGTLQIIDFTIITHILKGVARYSNGRMKK